MERLLELRARLEALATPLPRRTLRIATMVASTGIAVAVAFHSRSLFEPVGKLPSPQPGWLTLAIALEAVSLVCYALIVRGLLATSGFRARLQPLVRATVGGIAMGASLPAGQAASAAYWYRQLRQEGAEAGLAARAMVGSTLAAVASLAIIFAAGVAAAGSVGPLAAARVPILAGAAVLIVLRFVFRRRLRGTAPVLAAAYAYANWLLDCASLYASLAAVHASVPLRGILITYAFAQLVAALPLLPGGGGTVELSLTVGFAAFGHTSGNVVAGVLLFRLISCWGLVPVGWLAVALGSRSLGARWSAITCSFPSPR